MKSYYQKRKEQAIEEAKEWQLDFCNHNYYWSDLAYYSNYFETLARRYGLLKLFRAEGIC